MIKNVLSYTGYLSGIFLFILTMLHSPDVYGQNRILNVSGKVTDEMDAPVPGVSVRIAGSRLGTTTNNEGKYNITVNPSDTLEFSFIGFKSVRFPVKNRVDLDVKLEAAAGGLNEVSIV